MPRRRTGSLVYNKANTQRPGRYETRITLPDGRRKWFPFEATPESDEYAAHFRERSAKIAQDVVAHPEKYSQREPKPTSETVEEYSKRWLADRALRVSRIDNDLSRLKTHVLPLLGRKRIAEVEAADIRALVRRLDERIQSSEISAQTARHAWNLTLKLFKDAVRSKVDALRVRDTNPCDDVERPESGAKRGKQWLFPVEFDRLVRCEAVPLWWRELYTVASYLYLRAGELGALDWSAVNFDQDYVDIHHSVDLRTGKDKPTKGRANRRVLMPDALAPLLAGMRQRAGGSGLVIPEGPRRSQHPVHNIPQICPKLLRKHLLLAGVNRADLHRSTKTTKQITFHDLRATGITWEALAGTEHLRIQQRAGHGDLVETQGYIRLAEALGERMGEPFAPLPTLMIGVASCGENERETSSETSDFAKGSNNPKKRNPQGRDNLGDSGYATQDSNLRPSAPEADALSS